MKTIHTARTLEYFRRCGYFADVVERFIKNGAFGSRRDYAGIIDILALKPDSVVAIQSTGSDFSGHLKKMLTHEIEINGEMKKAGMVILESRIELCLMGWRKVKMKRGGVKMIYKPRIKFFSKDDFKTQ